MVMNIGDVGATASERSMTRIAQRGGPLRSFRMMVAILTSAILSSLGVAPAFADMTVLTYNTVSVRAGRKRMSDHSPVSTMAG